MPLLGSRGGASVRGFGLFGAIPEPAPTVIGQEYGGGYYAGLISLTGTGSATHYLVVAPKASGEAQRQWKTANTATTNTGSVINGQTNSSNMNNALHPAAQFCETLSLNGYGDWYMPARDELEVIYYNLKPSTQLNTTSSGANLNAVPSRAANYTTGDPAQTSVALFQSGGAEAFETEFYWASTQFSTANGWIQNFNDGEQSNVQKLSTTYVRAVRRVPFFLSPPPPEPSVETLVFQNDGFNYSVDGYADTTFPTLTLVRGNTYNFDFQAVGSGHPIALRLSSGNTSAVPGTTGNNPSSGVWGAGAVVTYVVPLDAPNNIVYQCVFHSSMIGTINITN